MMRGHKPDYYQAETPEELLVFLMGVYDWYPEEIKWDEISQMIERPWEHREEAWQAFIEGKALDEVWELLGRKNENLEV